jgi:hypothetical protein
MMRNSKETEYDEKLMKANDKHAIRYERLVKLHELLDAAKSCAKVGKFDVADELFSEFDELSKRNIE